MALIKFDRNPLSFQQLLTEFQVYRIPLHVHINSI